MREATIGNVIITFFSEKEASAKVLWKGQVPILCPIHHLKRPRFISMRYFVKENQVHFVGGGHQFIGLNCAYSNPDGQRVAMVLRGDQEEELTYDYAP